MYNGLKDENQGEVNFLGRLLPEYDPAEERRSIDVVCRWPRVGREWAIRLDLTHQQSHFRQDRDTYFDGKNKQTEF